MLKALTTNFKEEQLNAYFKFLTNLYNNSPIDEHYPKGQNEEEAKEEDDKEAEEVDENMRRDLIKTFAMNQLANFPQMFRNQLSVDLVNNLIEFLVQTTYFEQKAEVEDEE